MKIHHKKWLDHSKLENMDTAYTNMADLHLTLQREKQCIVLLNRGFGTYTEVRIGRWLVRYPEVFTLASLSFFLNYFHAYYMGLGVWFIDLASNQNVASFFYAIL